MEPVTMLLGAGAMGFGSYTTYLRLSDPSKLGKLGPMREKFGEKAGTAIHTVAYSIVPLLAGLIFLVAGMNGMSVL